MYTSWSGTSTTQVSGGTLNVKGISFLGQNDVSKGSVFLGTDEAGTASNEAATGRINIGESGIAALKNGDSKLVLGHGTMGALSDWATNTDHETKKITLLSASGTTFDTQDVNDASKGYTITLNHDLTGAGKIVKTGKGTLVLNGATSDFSGGIDLVGGNLTVSSSAAFSSNGNRKLTISSLATGADTSILSSKDGTLSLDSLTMVNGGRFDLGGTNVAQTLTVTSLTTTTMGTLVFGAGDALNVTGDLSHLTFEMSLVGYINGDKITLGTATGTLTDVLLKNSVVSNDYRATTATIAKDGNNLVATVAGGAGNLVWTVDNTKWDLKTDKHWAGIADNVFYQGDLVNFTDLATTPAETVTVAGTLLPGKMTLTNSVTAYTFVGEGANATITVIGDFTKTGTGLWTLGAGMKLILQGGFSMTKDTLSLAGGTLDLSGLNKTDKIDFGILQGVSAASVINSGSNKIMLGVKDANSATHLTLTGTGDFLGIGTHAINISGVTRNLFAGTAGLNIMGNTTGTANNIGIFGGSWEAQTAASGNIVIGAKTGETILDFGKENVVNNAGIFGAKFNLGDGTGVTDTTLKTNILSNISLVGTRTGEGAAMTSNTKITGKIYGGGIENTNIYGSTALSLDGIHLIGGTSEYVSAGAQLLVAGSNYKATIYGNSSLSVKNSLIDSFIFGTAGVQTGSITHEFADSIFKKNVYAGGYGGETSIKGNVSLTATNSTFSGSIYGGRDGILNGKVSLSLINSTVTGDVIGGYSVAGDKVKGGVDIVIDGSTVGGMLGIINGGSAANNLGILRKDSTITVKGNSTVGSFYAVGKRFSHLIGDLTLNIEGGTLGDGKTGKEDGAFLIAGQDSKIEGNATLNISGGTLKYEAIVFGGFGGTGITKDANLKVTGGTIESSIYGSGSWGNSIGGNFNMLLQGGVFGKNGAIRGIMGGNEMGSSSATPVQGNVSITLDGSLNGGLGASFLAGADGSKYYIYAGSVNGAVVGNTLVSLTGITQKGADGVGVANFNGVISGANGSGGGVTGAVRKLVFSNYTTETNAQFKYFTLAEVDGASNLTLKGNSSNIGSWNVKGNSILNLDSLAKLGGATSLTLTAATDTMNLALGADSDMGTLVLSGAGKLSLTGAHMLTIKTNQSGFNGTISTVAGATLALDDNGIAGSNTATLLTGGTLKVIGATDRTIAQKISGAGTLSLDLTTTDKVLSLTNTASDFTGTMTLNKGVLDLVTGSALSNVTATIGADAALLMSGTELSKFKSLTGTGNLRIGTTSNYTGDQLGAFSGKLSVLKNQSFGLTKTSASGVSTLNNGVTLDLGASSILTLTNNGATLWDQTVADIIGSGKLVLAGTQGITLHVTGEGWKDSSLNFTLTDTNLYKIYVGTSASEQMFTKMTITDGKGIVSNVIVGTDGLLTAFTNYQELDPNVLINDQNTYCKVTGVHGADGATTMTGDNLMGGLKITSVLETTSTPAATKNRVLALGDKKLTLTGGMLLIDGNADYLISGGTLLGSATNGLSITTAFDKTLTISSTIGENTNLKPLVKEGNGGLLLTGTLNVSQIDVNAGSLTLLTNATATGVTATVKQDASLSLGNASGLSTINNQTGGTVNVLDGGSLVTNVDFTNNGQLNYTIGAGKSMAQVVLKGTGTVGIKTGTLTIGKTTLSANQSYQVEKDARLSFNMEDSSADFAKAISGSGFVDYTATVRRDDLKALSFANFDGTLTLKGGRVRFSTGNMLKQDATIIVENGAQYWDVADAASARSYAFRLTGDGDESRGALRISNNAVYNGTMTLVGNASIGGASNDNATINSVITSQNGGILSLGTNGDNGIGTVTLTGDNTNLAGTELRKINKVIAGSTHAFGNKLTLATTNAGTQELELTANVELQSITGFIAGKTMNLMSATSGLTLTGTEGSNLYGNISGAGKLALLGSGTVIIGGNNTYTGGTTIKDAKVILETNATALGTSTVSLDNASLDMGGLAVSNALHAKTNASLAGIGAYVGDLTLNSVSGSTQQTLVVTGNLHAKSLNLADSTARIDATGDITITNGGSFTLDINNAYDATTNPDAIVKSTGTVTLGGDFALSFDTNLKAGNNIFQLFSGATFATGNAPTAHLAFGDDYLKTFFTLDASQLGTHGSVTINRNTPEGYFVNQADVNAMTGGYQSKVDTALGADASGTTVNPVNFDKVYNLVDDSYRFSNGQGWLNVQSALEGATNKVVVFDYIPGNGALPVGDDRGVIFSNNNNSFGGGLLANNVRIVADGSFASGNDNKPVAGGELHMLGTGDISLGGNKGVLELRPLGTGDASSFTLANNINLRDGASIEQTGGVNTLTGQIGVVSGNAILSNKTAHEMIFSGAILANAGTNLQLEGQIIFDKTTLTGDTLTLMQGADWQLRNGASAQVSNLAGSQGTLTVGDGTSVTLSGDANTLGSLHGIGSVILNNATLTLNTGNTLAADIQGKGALVLEANSSLTMAATGSLGKEVVLNLLDTNTLILAGNSVDIGTLTGSGKIDFGGATLGITGGSSEFSGTFTSGTLEQKSGNVLTLTSAGSVDTNLKASSGEIIIKNTAAHYGDVSAVGGEVTLVNNTTFKSLNVGTGGIVNLGQKGLDTAQAPISLTINGNATFGKGSTLQFIIPSATPQLSVTGTMTLSNQININLLDNLSGQFGSDSLNFVLMQADGGFLTEGGTSLANGTKLTDWNVNVLGSISLFYSSGLAYIDGNQIKTTAVKNKKNALESSAMSENAHAGANLLWDNGLQNSGTNLRYLLDEIMNDMKAGNYASASHAMAAAAGSTVTSLVASQKEGFRQQQIDIRNRTTQMGVNQDVVNENMPYFNMWMQGNGGYNKLDASGDDSGYSLSTWGGTVGFDVDLSDALTIGAAFTASYGDLEAQAADTAKGDMDSYYVNLFARVQHKAWSHTLILTGGWNDANLDRTVVYNGGAYKGNGDTTGSGYGAMYELTYDIALNEKKTSILQPLFNASIVSTKMDGYDETGAGNAGLHVDQMDMTTGTLALGTRLMGIVGNNLFGRGALGELRVNIAQDMGDDRGQADVGFLANPGFMQNVRGRKIGTTAFQVGAGLSVPVGQQGTVYLNADTDVRSGSTSVGGTIGYRYNF
ncbi:MAG: hypothetical protein RR506_02060 [Akkermansia sp.]